MNNSKLYPYILFQNDIDRIIIKSFFNHSSIAAIAIIIILDCMKLWKCMYWLVPSHFTGCTHIYAQNKILHRISYNLKNITEKKSDLLFVVKVVIIMEANTKYMCHLPFENISLFCSKIFHQMFINWYYYN